VPLLRRGPQVMNHGRCRQIPNYSSFGAPGGGCPCPDRDPLFRSSLFDADGSSGALLILTMRIPARPSRPQVISIPRVRKAVCGSPTAAGEHPRFWLIGIAPRRTVSDKVGFTHKIHEQLIGIGQSRGIGLVLSNGVIISPRFGDER
jgi:hypothetical protein